MTTEQTLSEHVKLYIAEHRVGRLATADEKGHPHVIPVCYAFDGKIVYSCVDEKPKTKPPNSLERVRNIRRNPHVALVIDEYSEDWSSLNYVVISGEANVMLQCAEHMKALRLLREKYPQYEAMRLEDKPVLKITPRKVTAWHS
ncbi:MAG: TIGR03668 family PPOX class F420-dependent oxidoreductase [Candidatus Bathyarchaeia archaeon]